MDILNSTSLFNRALGVEGLKYLFAGGIGFVVDYSLFFLLTYFGQHYLVAATISFLFGIATVYLFSIKWVFERRTLDSSVLEQFIFLLTGVIGLLLTLALLWLFDKLTDLHYLISKLIVVSIVLLWNFFSRKILLFK